VGAARSWAALRLLVAVGSVAAGLLAPAGPAARADVTEYPIPSRASFAQGIAAGPDGALWFTDGFAGMIGRIPASATPGNPQGTAFSIPTPNSQPIHITVGPDGALWLQRVGRTRSGGSPRPRRQRTRRSPSTRFPRSTA